LAGKILPRGNWHVLCAEDDINPNYVTAQVVDEAITDWLENTKKCLFNLTIPYQQHFLCNMKHFGSRNRSIQNSIPERILPTWETICYEIGCAYDGHRADIIGCQDQRDLTYIMSCLKSEADVLRQDIEARVALFEDYVQKGEACSRFVEQVQQMSTLLERFQALPIKHSKNFEVILSKALKECGCEWNNFLRTESVADLEKFHNRVRDVEYEIAVFWHQTLPKKQDGTAVNPESFIMGCEAAKKMAAYA
jgi:hypothetical protein